MACNRLTPTNLHSSLIIAHLRWLSAGFVDVHLQTGWPELSHPSIHADELKSLIIWQGDVLFSQIRDVTGRIVCVRVCVCFRAGFMIASAL